MGWRIISCRQPEGAARVETSIVVPAGPSVGGLRGARAGWWWFVRRGPGSSKNAHRGDRRGDRGLRRNVRRREERAGAPPIDGPSASRGHRREGRVLCPGGRRAAVARERYVADSPRREE